MKKLAVFQFCILSVVSGAVTALTFFTGRLAAYHWNESLDGAVLPAVTVFASQYGWSVPLVCCLAAIICVAISYKRPDKLALLWYIYTLIAAIGLVSQGLFAWFWLQPALTITYRLM